MPNTNRLAGEQSPYLLQHQHNPVDWYPWGDEAFARATADDKPIFLSIGYATCHWCHVMERESFEDEAVARHLNDGFVSIKVDREERPDVDSIYMAVCQMLTGQGGWPLTIIMTPDRRPFYAATYIPKDSRYGRPGMMDLLPRLAHVWRTQRDEVLRSAAHLTDTLKRSQDIEPEQDGLTQQTLDQAYDELHKRFDAHNGGFGSAPKFPTPHNLLFLLRYWSRTGSVDALNMVVETLVRMRLGGIYDHLGGGFHRYSTDAGWHLPHFEKMLYDQALLGMAYAEAFHATGEPLFEETTRDIFRYVERDLLADEGAFYSAEDADSEGREGKFYVWTTDEVRDVLDPNRARLVLDVYGLEDDGNFEEEATRERTGENVLYLSARTEVLAAQRGMEPDVLRAELARARSELLAARSRRVRPELDDKVLTDWNGLMIASLAIAGRHLKDSSYTDRARSAAQCILDRLRTEGGLLLHRYRAGSAGISGMADDYAFMVWALIELYETTFEASYLREALGLTAIMERLFWDETRGGFYMAQTSSSDLIVRQKELYDGAIPSANSIQTLNFLRLGRLTGNADFDVRALQIIRFASSFVRRHPSAFTGFMLGLEFAFSPSLEVVIAGDPAAAGTQDLIDCVRGTYRPNIVVLLRPDGDGVPEIAEISPFLAEQGPVNGRPAAYVCRNFACERPTTDPSVLAEMLSPPGSGPDS